MIPYDARRDGNEIRISIPDPKARVPKALVLGPNGLSVASGSPDGGAAGLESDSRQDEGAGSGVVRPARTLREALEAVTGCPPVRIEWVRDSHRTRSCRCARIPPPPGPTRRSAGTRRANRPPRSSRTPVVHRCLTSNRPMAWRRPKALHQPTTLEPIQRRRSAKREARFLRLACMKTWLSRRVPSRTRGMALKAWSRRSRSRTSASTPMPMSAPGASPSLSEDPTAQAPTAEGNALLEMLSKKLGRAFRPQAEKKASASPPDKATAPSETEPAPETPKLAPAESPAHERSPSAETRSPGAEQLQAATATDSALDVSPLVIRERAAARLLGKATAACLVGDEEKAMAAAERAHRFYAGTLSGDQAGLLLRELLLSTQAGRGGSAVGIPESPDTTRIPAAVFLHLVERQEQHADFMEVDRLLRQWGPFYGPLPEWRACTWPWARLSWPRKDRPGPRAPGADPARGRGGAARASSPGPIYDESGEKEKALELYRRVASSHRPYQARGWPGRPTWSFRREGWRRLSTRIPASGRQAPFG